MKKKNKNPYKIFAKPYLVWLYLLAILPIIIMIVLSFTQTEGLDFSNFKVTFDNFLQLGEKSTQIAFLNSFFISIVATSISLILGYAVAYLLYKSKIKNKFLVLVILILPMWSNILLRIEALGNIMEPQNILNDLLNKIGLSFSLDIKGTYLAVMIGLVLTYMPFTILPIYNALEKIDPSIEEGALDLGLTERQTFFKIILPLSLKGIVTGSIMTLLPCLSGFAIPEILGNGNIVMIGNIIDQMYREMNYNIGSLLGIIIVIIIMAGILIINKVDKGGDTIL